MTEDKMKKFNDEMRRVMGIIGHGMKQTEKKLKAEGAVDADWHIGWVLLVGDPSRIDLEVPALGGNMGAEAAVQFIGEAMQLYAQKLLDEILPVDGSKPS